MQEVLLLTLTAVGTLLIYIAIGYFLRRHHDLPDEAGRVLSLLTTLLFNPCYTIVNLSKSLTADVIMDKLAILGYGVVFVVVAYGFAFLLSKPFGKTDEERRSLIYAFSTPNYGYFGYPVIQAVFGDQVLADVMIFATPLGIAGCSIGYLQFMKDKRIRWLTVLLSPMMVGTFIGAALGLSGLQLPEIVLNVLTNLGNCMSIASMLLGGFMLGKFPLKKLLSGWRPYYLSAVRMFLIPLTFGLILWFGGIRGIYLMLPMLIVGLPLGLNLVVFPESQGQDRLASDNAKLCFISYLLSIVVLPCTFALITWLLQFQ